MFFELPGFVSEEGELMCDRPALLAELEKRGLTILDMMENAVITEVKWGPSSPVLRFEFKEES
jgi:hypothetical protein